MSGENAIYLVSCVKMKRIVPTPAKDMYISPWFRKARAYVEEREQTWFILSAKHGVVQPDDVIEPYDLTLNAMRVNDRRLWADEVLTQLEPHLKDLRSVTFLAGRNYREFLEPPLRNRGLAVLIPMEGLGIGKQLQWLNQGILHG